jgi:hypothetical protein
MFYFLGRMRYQSQIVIPSPGYWGVFFGISKILRDSKNATSSVMESVFPNDISIRSLCSNTYWDKSELYGSPLT